MTDVLEKIVSAAKDALLNLECIFNMPIKNGITLAEFEYVANNWGTDLDYSILVDYPEYGNLTKINREDRL